MYTSCSARRTIIIAYLNTLRGGCGTMKTPLRPTSHYFKFVKSRGTPCDVDIILYSRYAQWICMYSVPGVNFVAFTENGTKFNIIKIIS